MQLEKLYELEIGGVVYQALTDWDDIPHHLVIINENKSWLTLKVDYNSARQITELAEKVVDEGREIEDYELE